MSEPVSRLDLVEVVALPKILAPDKFYVSREFETSAHLCCCGCGSKVVNPLTPGRWRLTEGADGFSLSPSIGNTAFACRSHYFIKGGRVMWAAEMTDAQHAAAIKADERALEDALATKRVSVWRRIWKWLRARIPF